MTAARLTSGGGGGGKVESKGFHGVARTWRWQLLQGPRLDGLQGDCGVPSQGFDVEDRALERLRLTNRVCGSRSKEACRCCQLSCPPPAACGRAKTKRQTSRRKTEAKGGCGTLSQGDTEIGSHTHTHSVCVCVCVCVCVPPPRLTRPPAHTYIRKAMMKRKSMDDVCAEDGIEWNKSSWASQDFGPRALEETYTEQCGSQGRCGGVCVEGGAPRGLATVTGHLVHQDNRGLKSETDIRPRAWVRMQGLGPDWNCGCTRDRRDVEDRQTLGACDGKAKTEDSGGWRRQLARVARSSPGQEAELDGPPATYTWARASHGRCMAPADSNQGAKEAVYESIA